MGVNGVSMQPNLASFSSPIVQPQYMSSQPPALSADNYTQAPSNPDANPSLRMSGNNPRFGFCEPISFSCGSCALIGCGLVAAVVGIPIALLTWLAKSIK